LAAVADSIPAEVGFAQSTNSWPTVLVKGVIMGAFVHSLVLAIGLQGK